MKALKLSLFMAIAVFISMNSQCQNLTVNDEIAKAQDLAKQGNAAEASALYTDLMTRYPHSMEVVQGWLMINIKRSPTGEEEAITQLEELEKTHPENSAIVFFKGFIQLEYGHNEDALKTTQRLIELKPDIGLNWLMRGQNLEALDRNDEAMAAYEKATSLDMNNADAWQNKAGLLLKTGRYDEAIEAYNKAVTLSPSQPVFLYNRGCAYSLKGDKSNALADLKKAVSINPQMKASASQDPDYKSLWEDADFKAIVSQ